jgi:hypothetical protein
MRRRLLSALAAALVTAPVAAQDFSSIGGQYIDYGASMMAVGQLNNVLDNTTQRGGSGARAVDTRYRASPAVSARVRAQFADFAAEADPANADRLRQAIGRQDLLALWEKHVAVDGLKRGDAADAMTAYWVQNWQLATGTTFVDRARVQAVRGQIGRALAANPAFARLDDAGKQEMAEIFMLNFVAQGSAYSDAMARRDEALARRLSDAAAARLRSEMKLDARQVRLTPAGFSR